MTPPLPQPLSPAPRIVERLPARPIPAVGESFDSFVARTAAANATAVAVILGRPRIARGAPDYPAILGRVAALTGQPRSRIVEMTLDSVHPTVLASTGWSAAGWGQHCPCAPPNIGRRDWALALAPICRYCRRLVQLPGTDTTSHIPIPGEITRICFDVLAAAYRSATDTHIAMRLQTLRTDLPWIIRRISKSWAQPEETADLLFQQAVDDLVHTGEPHHDGATAPVPHSAAVRAIAIAVGWASQPAGSVSPIPPSRPALHPRHEPSIRDGDVFARRVIRPGWPAPQIMPRPGWARRFPNRIDLLRLVIGSTALTIDHIPGSYRQDGEPFWADRCQWLWRARVAALLGHCAALRGHWDLTDEPIHRYSRDHYFYVAKGHWPSVPPILVYETDIAHAMNLARILVGDGLIDYRCRRDLLRPLVQLPVDLAAQLPRPVRALKDYRRIGAAWIWSEATADRPPPGRPMGALSAFDTLLGSSGRNLLRGYACELLAGHKAS